MTGDPTNENASETPNPEKPFNLDDYVDLSGMVQEPVLRDEIRDRLLYFASKPMGRALIMEAAAHSKFGRLTITKGPKSHYDHFTQTLSILPEQLRGISYFTTPEQTPDHVAPLTLGHTLWHELEHARDPKAYGIHTPQAEQELRDVAAKTWAEQEASAIAAYAREHPDNVVYLPAVPGKAPLVAFVDNMSIEQFRAVAIDAYSAEYQKRANTGWTSPARAHSGLLAFQMHEMQSGINETLLEQTAIERTNAALKEYYPDQPARYGHSAHEDMVEHSPLIDGTPHSPLKTLPVEHPLPKPPTRLLDVALPPALVEWEKQHASGAKSPASQEMVEKLAQIDLKSINMQSVSGPQETTAIAAHSASPAATNKVAPATPGKSFGYV